jgi:hypothetical protein
MSVIINSAQKTCYVLTQRYPSLKLDHDTKNSAAFYIFNAIKQKKNFIDTPSIHHLGNMQIETPRIINFYVTCKKSFSQRVNNRYIFPTTYLGL